jgi:hypothetical protein
MKKLIAAMLLLTTAPAWSQSPPYVYAQTVGTASSVVLPPNNARKRVIFFNVNTVAKIAICPIGPARGPAGATVVAAVNGAGCMTLLPYAQLTVDGGLAPGPLLSMPSSWIAISDTAGAALTVWEWE